MDKSALELTFVIPLFNKAKFINRAVESILRQQRYSAKVIVINDGSTDDGCLRLAEQPYASEITIVNTPNRGVSSARNTGFKIATTRYVGFLDADDELADDALRTIKQLIDDYPTYSFFGFGYRRATKPEHAPATRGEINFLRYSIENFRPPLSASSVVLDRNAINFPVFPEGSGMGEDIYAWLYLLSKGHKLVFEPRVVAIYHDDDPSSAVLAKRGKQLPAFLRDQSVMAAQDQDDVRRFLAYHSSDYIKSHILYGSRRRCLSYILSSGRFSLCRFIPLLFVPRLVWSLNPRWRRH